MRKKILLVVLLIALLFSAGYFGYKYLRGESIIPLYPTFPKDKLNTTERNIEEANQTGPLDSISDPAVYPHMYMIVSFDPNTETLELKRSWPIDDGQKTISTKIECNVWDIKLVDTDKKTAKIVTKQTLFRTIGTSNMTYLIFQGTCRDNVCNVIDKACTLYVHTPQ